MADIARGQKAAGSLQRAENRGHPPSQKLRRGKEIRRQRSAAFAKASARQGGQKAGNRRKKKGIILWERLFRPELVEGQPRS